GERAGNVSWDELLPTLRYKYNVKIIDDEKLRMLKPIVEYFQRITGFRIPPNKPYVGDNVFTHAGGAHTDAVLKYANSYEHINPELVGNARSFVLSDQAGSASIVAVAEKFGYILNKNAPAVKKMLDIVKSKHHFTDTQLYLLLASEVDKKPLPFELMDYETRSKMHGNSKTWVKVRINKNLHTADAEGVGPVHSFDLALRKVLSKHLTKKIEKVALTSYHVTIYREEKGTAALTEVSIGFNSNGEKGSTIGESEDILKASVPPLVEGYTYFLYRLNKK
ncbi:MAG TPA: alpha-isopropylmalate synthase regulatory domain-containing protein, partial [archaeon]|nr:alpha-isopropylmalate synthase regulatory domain-containing protein [archaeon]